MYSDGNAFLSRANVFLAELKAGNYPNASSLATATECSVNTAQRVIYRLRDEYYVPIEYHQERHGYYLQRADYQFPEILPPGKDELSAFVLAKSFLGVINDPTLNRKLNDIYHDYLAKSLHPEIANQLKPIADIFSCDLTAVSIIADWGILDLLQAAILGENLEITYKSPWRHQLNKTYQCRIKKIHYSDGNLYLLVTEPSGSYRTLNAAFIKSFQILESKIDFQATCEQDFRGDENWLEGFGVFSGEELTEITLRILPPAAEYYAAQTWHDSQQDSWEGAVLVRKLKAIISPELERRVMSIGRYLCQVQPESLHEKVLAQVQEMQALLKSS